MKFGSYEKELLAMAVEACDDHKCLFMFGWASLGPQPVHAHAINPNGAQQFDGRGDSPAAALSALLRDLGIEPPERPSEEAVAEAKRVIYLDGITDPLLVAAVLEAVK